VKSSLSTVNQIQEYFNERLGSTYDKEEIKSICLLSLEKILEISRSELRSKADMQVQEDHGKKFISIVDELIENKPIQYILGETEFYGLKISVDERVLIPRPETEELVDWIIKTQSHHHKISNSELSGSKPNVIDLATGSGCIAIALKANLTDTNLFAIDVSKPALALAETNASANEVAIQFLEADILAPSFLHIYNPDFFDVIVSNPPYVCELEAQQMPKNVLEYEPHLALFVPDANPLLFYEAILKFAQIFLKKEGYLFFEINESLGIELVKLCISKGFRNVELKKDLSNKSRMIRAQK
jgi:release factor glutamine methyltransferase